MPKKQMKKKPQRKKKKSPARKPSKSKPAPKKPSKKLKKSIARKAVRKAVAKRAKKASKKGVKSMKKKPSKRKPPQKSKAKTTVKKKESKKRTRPTPSVSKARKKSPKSIKKKITKKKPAGKTPTKKKPPKAKKAKQPAKRTSPKIREKKKPVPSPQRELNRAEVSRLLSDAYARHLIIEAGGEHALEIVRGFSNNSCDEDISKKLKIKISDVRATLNKLHSLGIVDYTRHKDSETGWFSYFWCLNVNRMKTWVNSRIEEERKNFDFSKGEYYFCPNCGGASIHEFVSASDFGFKCPTCSSALDFLSEDKAEELFPMKAFRKPHL